MRLALIQWHEYTNNNVASDCVCVFVPGSLPSASSVSSAFRVLSVKLRFLLSYIKCKSAWLQILYVMANWA